MQPIGSHGGEVMYFGCVCFWGELGFLNCEVCCVVVCGSDLQRGHSGDGCLSSSILFEYERSRGHLFVLGWASQGTTGCS